jgi:anti-anti-sigma factor
MKAARISDEPRKLQSMPAGVFEPAAENGAACNLVAPSMNLALESPQTLELGVRDRGTTFLLNDGRLVVVVSNTLSVENAKSFQSAVLGEIKDSVRAIDLDLSGIRRFDTWALCTLLSLRKYSNAREIQFRLIDPSPRVETILEMTKTRKLFEVVQADAGLPESCGDRDAQRHRAERMG